MIIFELLLTISFIQSKNCIYRNLKPNNIIIDQDKNTILIDFDRLINYQEDIIDENTTHYFSNVYICPEIMLGTIKEYTFFEDIYSIGILIYYIMFERFPDNKNDKLNEYSFIEFRKNYPNLEKLCERCTQMEPKNRPTIYELVNFFIKFITDLYKNENIFNEKCLYAILINKIKYCRGSILYGI